jgi:glycerophosphoryl diester phosphodiesterase
MHATASPLLSPATRSARPFVVGHRGAPSFRPEHTRASYELAIDQGVDLIEPDVVLSRDGALVVRHETELSLSTDVAGRPEFADRRTTRTFGATRRTGWFTEDFTLAELRTLRAVERFSQLRPLNTAYDGQDGILTLAEVVEIARRRSTPERPVRVLVELKKPIWWAEQGLPMVELVVAELRRLGADGSDGSVLLQSFDAPAVRRLRELLGDDGPRLIQLIAAAEGHDSLVTPAGLREVSTYAQGIGPNRHRILLRDANDVLTGVSDLVHRAHEVGLAVVPWALRGENAFLPQHLRRGSDPAGIGDAEGEARLLLALGVDGLITDCPEVALRVREELTGPGRGTLF